MHKERRRHRIWQPVNGVRPPMHSFRVPVAIASGVKSIALRIDAGDATVDEVHRLIDLLKGRSIDDIEKLT
jgi:hypothetical protein